MRAPHLAVVTAVLVTGCARQGQLNGQVFIVTQGRENVKMGAVQVIAIPDSAMKPLLASKPQEAAAEHEKLNRESQKCWDDMKRSTAMAEGDPKMLEFERITKECAMSEKPEDSLMAKHAVRMAAIRTGETLFDALPKPDDAIVGKTDADGRFTLTLLRGNRYALACRAQRSVPGQSDPEKYFWLLWVKPEAEKTELLLSNDNLMSEAGPARVVELPAAPPKS